MSILDNLVDEAIRRIEPQYPVRARRVIERASPVMAGEDEPALSSQGRSFTRGYRPFGSVSNVEADMEWWDAARRSEQLWRHTPLGRRVNETPQALVLSRGVTVMANDNRAALARQGPQGWGDDSRPAPRSTVQDVLDEFWDRNGLAERMWDIELALRIRGTVFLPVFVRVSSGRVTIRSLNGQIRDILESPEDMEDVAGVTCSPLKSGDEERRFRVIARRSAKQTEWDDTVFGLVKWDKNGAGKDENGETWDGQGILLRVNRLPDYKWGWPMALPVLDHIDQADDFFFDMLDRVYWLSALVWRWVFEGAKWEDLAPGGKFYNFVQQNPPRAGGNLLLNQRVSAEPITPAFSSGDMMTYTRIIMIMVGALGFGLSPMHFGVGEGANRAIGQEQGHPTRRLYEGEQAMAAGRWRLVCDFAIDSAVRAGRLPRRDSKEGRAIDWGYSINMPGLDVRDLEAQAKIIKTVAEAVASAGMMGLPFDEITWSDILSKAISEFGVDPTMVEGGGTQEEPPVQEQRADQLAHRLRGVWSGIAEGAQ